MTVQKDPEGTEIHQLVESAVFMDQNVLEIGCGEGRLTWRVGPLTGHLTGIDTEADALRVAAVECPVELRETVKFVRASAINLPFPKETFDIAILSWSF
jgi:ubiquinone/menaquinone biosynthesis C-methylase UbiE